MYPYYFQRRRRPFSGLYNGYLPYPYYPYVYGYGTSVIGGQYSNINQQLYNAGVMAGVTQSAISNNLIY